MDLAAGCHAELTADHHPLAGPEPLVDHNQIPLSLPERHGPEFGRGVLLHDVDELALGRELRRGRGHQHRVSNRAQDEANLDEPARPEAMITVLDGGAELQGARCVLHGVVEEGEFPLTRLVGAFGNAHLDSQAPPGGIPLHRGKVILGNGQKGQGKLFG